MGASGTRVYNISRSADLIAGTRCWPLYAISELLSSSGSSYRCLRGPRRAERRREVDAVVLLHDAPLNDIPRKRPAAHAQTLQVPGLGDAEEITEPPRHP